MKVIRRRLFLLAIASGLSLLFSILICFLNAVIQPSYAKLILIFTSLVAVFVFGFLINEYKRNKIANLIIENKILHIYPVKTGSSLCGRTESTSAIGDIEVFISCFGMLLNSKVIKFNLDGIRLKAVEIGREFICLTYGTDAQLQKTQILHQTFDKQELQSIIEKFHHETGVVPVIADL